ncbi:MAG: peptidoglycan DD-metalloendopeptidase family protein [Armatimonadetes bacterium]|nr:peptidoglycan DD-metalloendopeptidase family protein [Armatimonadota bacterium]
MRALILVLSMVIMMQTSFATPSFNSVVKTLVDSYNHRDWNPIEALFDKQMATAVPLNRLTAIGNMTYQQCGAIQSVEPAVMTSPSIGTITAHCREGIGLVFTVSMDEDGHISGLFIKPVSGETAHPPQSAVHYRLPFKEKWYVFWGGPTVQENYHHPVLSQRYAIDFLIRNASGLTHRGSGDKLSDYYAYGKTILAPAGGKVVMVVSGAPDNPPGVMDPFIAVGNCIELQTAPHEYVIMAHLKPGSIRVHTGERVKAGQPIALCGNSGNTSEPHLHFQIQNRFNMAEAVGLYPMFADYRSQAEDGPMKEVKLGSPVRGELVEAK